MTKPRYNWPENNVLAACPECKAITSFDDKGFSSTKMGASLVNSMTRFEGQTYTRVLWQALRCNVCGRGAIAKILDNGNSQGAVLQDFIPRAVESQTLPPSVPDEIVKEFREAELVASIGAYRGGSALLRSVLEKTLTKNGYDEVDYLEGGIAKKSKSLLRRIDAASDDGVITETRKKRAHENIRVLGNDVLHDDWREVLHDEFEDAHKYSQRILEDFYDDRPTVEARLKSKGRLP
ncbi:MAG: DUF4145 domain-containing protein [Terracidiphilus sp.]